MSRTISKLAVFAIAARTIFSVPAMAEETSFLPQEFTQENIDACFEKLAKKPDYQSRNRGLTDYAKLNGLTCGHSRDNQECSVNTKNQRSVGVAEAGILWSESTSFRSLDKNDRVTSYEAYANGAMLSVAIVSRVKVLDGFDRPYQQVFFDSTVLNPSFKLDKVNTDALRPSELDIMKSLIAKNPCNALTS